MTRTYESVLKEYNDLTAQWIAAKNDNDEDLANSLRTKRYELLDLMNELNPETEEEKFLGFLL